MRHGQGGWTSQTHVGWLRHVFLWTWHVFLWTWPLLPIVCSSGCRLQYSLMQKQLLSAFQSNPILWLLDWCVASVGCQLSLSSCWRVLVPCLVTWLAALLGACITAAALKHGCMFAHQLDNELAPWFVMHHSCCIYYTHHSILLISHTPSYSVCPMLRCGAGCTVVLCA